MSEEDDIPPPCTWARFRWAWFDITSAAIVTVWFLWELVRKLFP